MSYLRWSTPLRECNKCGGKDPMSLTVHKYLDEMEVRRGCECVSCWYIYWHCDDYISINHAGDHVCPAGGTGDARLEFDDALDWRPPEGCPRGSYAIAAVAEAHRDWQEEISDLRCEHGELIENFCDICDPCDDGGEDLT